MARPRGHGVQPDPGCRNHHRSDTGQSQDRNNPAETHHGPASIATSARRLTLHLTQGLALGGRLDRPLHPRLRATTSHSLTTQPQQAQPEQQRAHHRNEAGQKAPPETAIDDPDQNRVLKPNPSADRGSTEPWSRTCSGDHLTLLAGSGTTTEVCAVYSLRRLPHCHYGSERGQQPWTATRQKPLE